MFWNNIMNVHSQEKVAVLKGFVFGVNWNTDNHRCVIQEAIKDLQKYDAIAWDGDLLKNDSFTRVLFDVMLTYPAKQYIAFKKSKSKHKLQGTYSENNHGVMASGFPHVTKNPIFVIEMKNNISWQKMGINAIQKLQMNFNEVNIFFFGQGNVAKSEEKSISLYPKVKVIRKYRVVRKNISQ